MSHPQPINRSEAQPASWADYPEIRAQLDRVVASGPAVEWCRSVGVTHTVEWIEYRGPEVDRLLAMRQTAGAFAVAEHDRGVTHWMDALNAADSMWRQDWALTPAFLRASRPIDRMISEALSAARVELAL